MVIPWLSAINFPKVHPDLVRLGPIAIRWYGVAYLTGFLSAYLVLRRMIRIGQLKITRDQLGDLMTWIVLAVVVGGRAGWWLVYHRPTAAAEPWFEPLAIWHGGMSFHGGLAGVAVALLAWSRFHPVSVWHLADAAAAATPIGLFFGRIANFINAELVGRPTNVPWGVIFPGDTIARHPSQLYEAGLEGITLFTLLWVGQRFLNPFEGRTAAAFLMLYGCFRFLVEFTREPDPQLGFIALRWVTMGQLLSVVTILAGLLLWKASRPVIR